MNLNTAALLLCLLCDQTKLYKGTLKFKRKEIKFKQNILIKKKKKNNFLIYNKIYIGILYWNTDVELNFRLNSNICVFEFKIIVC